MKSSKKTSIRSEDIVYIIGCLLAIAIAITKIFVKEDFEQPVYQEINKPALDKRAIDRIKLQYVINKYETNHTCCDGYTEPSHTCAFSYNSNFTSES